MVDGTNNNGSEIEETCRRAKILLASKPTSHNIKTNEKLFLDKLKPTINQLIPDQQFGFRQEYSTFEQVHNIAM